MSKDATKIYSTWLASAPRGYWGRTLFCGYKSSFVRRAADRDECCEDGPMEEVLDLVLGSEVRSVSAMGGCGDLDGREWKDICDGERDGGNEERDVRRW
jgi:hypothetical protein